MKRGGRQLFPAIAQTMLYCLPPVSEATALATELYAVELMTHQCVRSAVEEMFRVLLPPRRLNPLPDQIRFLRGVMCQW